MNIRLRAIKKEFAALDVSLSDVPSETLKKYSKIESDLDFCDRWTRTDKELCTLLIGFSKSTSGPDSG